MGPVVVFDPQQPVKAINRNNPVQVRLVNTLERPYEYHLDWLLHDMDPTETPMHLLHGCSQTTNLQAPNCSVANATTDSVLTCVLQVSVVEPIGTIEHVYTMAHGPSCVSYALRMLPRGEWEVYDVVYPRR